MTTVDEDMLNTLGRLHYPIPAALKAVAASALDHRLHEAVDDLGKEGTVERINGILLAGKAWGYVPGDRDAIANRLSEQLQSLLSTVRSDSDVPKLVAEADKLLDAAGLLEIPLDLWQTQNHLLGTYARLAEKNLPEPLKQAFAHLAQRLNVSPNLLGWKP